MWPFKKSKDSSRMLAAEVSRLTDDLHSVYTSFDDEIKNDIIRLSSRCRKLGTDNEFAASYLNLLVGNVWGAGPKISFRPENADGTIDTNLQTALDTAFWDWAKPVNCSTSGIFSWDHLNKIGIRALGTDGNMFFIDEYSGKYGYKITPKEIDYLDIDSNRNSGSEWVVMGIKYDADGVKSYRFLDHANSGYRPLGISFSVNKTREIDANRVTHAFIRLRGSQSIGIPLMTPSVLPLHHLAEIKKSAQIAVRIAACVGGVISESSAQTKSLSNVKWEPGFLLDIGQGKFQPFTPSQPTQFFEPFVKTCLQGTSAALSASYAAISGNYGDFNYAGGRMAAHVERDNYSVLQDDWEMQVIRPIIDKWVMHALESKAIKINGRPVSFSELENCKQYKLGHKRWPMVDVLAETKAKLLLLEKTLSTKTDIASDLGHEFGEIIKMRKQELELEIAELTSLMKNYAETVTPENKSEIE